MQGYTCEKLYPYVYVYTLNGYLVVLLDTYVMDIHTFVNYIMMKRVFCLMPTK
jgi:hypothetical protein